MRHCWAVIVNKVCGDIKSFSVSQEAYENREDAMKFIESRTSAVSYWIDMNRYYVQIDPDNLDDFYIYEMKELSIVGG